MEKKYIDINCDLGEGIGPDSDLMPLITSCNIACGGHAGSADSIRKTAELALKYRVKIGAHPSYPDMENFGRKTMDLSPGELKSSIESQLHTMMKILDDMDADLHHIKAHGALYNDIAKDEEKASTYLEALEPFREQVVVFAPFKSAVARMATMAGFTIWYEAFADRMYNDDLTLVSRGDPGAVITDPEDVADHVVRMVNEETVLTISGKSLPIEAQTYCVHGDNPNALEIINYLSRTLPARNIEVKR